MGWYHGKLYVNYIIIFRNVEIFPQKNYFEDFFFYFLFFCRAGGNEMGNLLEYSGIFLKNSESNNYWTLKCGTWAWSNGL